MKNKLKHVMSKEEYDYLKEADENGDSKLLCECGRKKEVVPSCMCNRCINDLEAEIFATSFHGNN